MDCLVPQTRVDSAVDAMMNFEESGCRPLQYVKNSSGGHKFYTVELLLCYCLYTSRSSLHSIISNRRLSILCRALATRLILFPLLAIIALSLAYPSPWYLITILIPFLTKPYTRLCTSFTLLPMSLSVLLSTWSLIKLLKLFFPIFCHFLLPCLLLLRKCCCVVTQVILSIHELP
jgi:hypothetical protein